MDWMSISGGPAGGCLALLYAYRDGAASPLPVRAVFEMVGPPSFCHEDWGIYGLAEGTQDSHAAAAGLFSVMAGQEITPGMIAANSYTEQIRGISADMWVTEQSPPTLAAYGVHDRICPFPSVARLIRALEQHHVPYDYIEFPHSGHGLQNDGRLYEAYMDKMEEYLDKYTQQAQKSAPAGFPPDRGAPNILDLY